MKNKGCAIQIFLLIILALILTQCSCMSAATLPTVAVTVESVNKDVLIHTPPAPTQITKVICLTADTVYMREGAGTGYEVIAVLSAGDTVTVSGGFAQSPDGGVWYPIEAGGLTGYTNARYLCE